MEMEYQNDLIEYALNINLLKKEDDFFILNEHKYSNDLVLINKLKENLPICEIIDLVKEAIILGIVADVSDQYKRKLFLDLNNYTNIINASYFIFKINSESFDDILYKVTFDKKKHDIKKKIEYASRTSLFVDTLMKRIMAKYNILLVRKALFKTDKYPSLLKSNLYDFEFQAVSDSEGSTDTIQHELKVMINYQDNFSNQTVSKNVIDDIFVTLSGNKISYGFYNIGQSEAEPIYDAINEDVDAGDIDSLLRIRNLMTDPEVKFNIFETLRENENTNLSRLIKERYDNLKKSNLIDPKIEFTVTPLSIYCNHIVEKKCTYKVTSVNPYYKDYPLFYEVSYNPANLEDVSYDVDVDGIPEKVNDQELILAYDDAPTFGPVSARMTIKRCAVNLYGFNERFNLDIYKDVYFLKNSLVKLIDNKVEPFDGILDDNTFLKSQIVKGEISGKYYYIGDTIELNPKDILGAVILNDNSKHYVSKEYARLCPTCGHKFGAIDEVWSLYQQTHIIVNKDDLSCCDYCAFEDDNSKYNNGKSILYSKGQKKYFLDDLNNIKNTDVCIACKNKNDALLFVDLNMKTHLPDLCVSCKRYYCPKHINQKTHLCVNCTKNPEAIDIVNLDRQHKTLLKLNFKLTDLIGKETTYYYNADWNALWVYVDGKKSYTTYYLITDDNNKFMHLEKVTKIKR